MPIKPSLIFSETENPEDVYFLWDKDRILASAEAGDVRGEVLAGIGYYKAQLGFPYNIEKAVYWLGLAKSRNIGFYKRKSEKAAICTALGFCQLYGLAGETEDLAQAIIQYSFTPCENYIPAKFLNAVIEFESEISEIIPSHPFEKNITIQLVINKIESCAKEGFGPAIAYLGARCLDGWGYWKQRQDLTQGIALLNEAAKQGDGPATLTLALGYKLARYGLPYDREKALELFYQCVEKYNLPGAREQCTQLEIHKNTEANTTNCTIS